MHKGILVILTVSVQLISIVIFAQDKTLAILEEQDTVYRAVIDSTDAARILEKRVQEYKSDGYFGADFTFLAQTKDTFTSTLLRGRRYEYLHIRNHNLEPGFLSSDSQVTLSIREFSQFQKLLLTEYENTGFPFANFFLTNTDIASDTLECDLLFYPFTEILYDSIVYYGKSQMSKKYISKYLDIEQGKPYREDDIKEIDKKLRNLPLVKITRPSQVVFFRRKARIILYIDDVVTDRIDGIVGLAPNSANSEENNLLLTGELNIELNNLFKSGKRLELHWRNYLQRSQKLDASFTYPYLFNTKLGVNAELNLNKFDTLFLNVMSKLSLRYQRRGNNFIEFYYQNVNSTMLSVDTAAIRASKSLPSNNPYNIDNYGLAIFQRDVDYLPNPRKGYHLTSDLAIGQKTILRNQDVRKVLFNDGETGNLINVYETVPLKSVRLDLKLDVSVFIPIKKRATFHQAVTFRGLFADQIFFNELYNFGGYSTLRGFDENELFASKMLSYTAEYRYLIGQNSHVGFFINTAAIENTLESEDLVYDVPYGFGALANIQVGKGILSLAYALGSQQRNPLQLSTAKFHFGIINYF